MGPYTSHKWDDYLYSAKDSVDEAAGAFEEALAESEEEKEAAEERAEEAEAALEAAQAELEALRAAQAPTALTGNDAEGIPFGSNIKPQETREGRLVAATTTVKEVLATLDWWANRVGYGAAHDFWLIISALRGPDEEQQFPSTLKADTTGQIRLRALPLLAEIAGANVAYSRAADSTVREAADKSTSSHFTNHILWALAALNRAGL